VTSALRYNTDLTIDNDRIDFRGEVETDDALRVKIVWQNNTGEPIVMGLPDHTEVVLEPEDTILLYTTRKFSTERLKKLTAACDLTPIEHAHSGFRHTRRPSPFGLDLLLLAPGTAEVTTATTLADDIWST
jgi:hypothetical protein